MAKWLGRSPCLGQGASRRARVGRVRSQAFLSVLHTSDDLTLDISHSQYLQDETFQVPRFRHGGKDGMVAGLSTLFKQADLPLCISCSKPDTRPQFLFSHVVGAGTRDQKSLRLGESHPKQIHIFVSSQGTRHGLFTAGKRRGIEQHQIIAAPSPFQLSHLLKRIRRSIDTTITHLV